MDKRQLGQTGIEVSPIGLGTVKFGRNKNVKYPQSYELPSDEHLSNLLVQAKALGINTLDTAPSYGSSEERLGRLLYNQRNEWVIIDKAGEEFKDNKSSYIFTADHFERSLERSLKRLNTDYIDVLLIHSDGHDIEILSNNSLIKKLHHFKEQGLVKAIGASTKTIEGGIMALQLLDVVMATYNTENTNEKPVLNYAAEYNKGLILKKVMASGHTSSPSKSLEFAFSHPGVTSAIIGTININHLKENVKTTTQYLSLIQKE